MEQRYLEYMRRKEEIRKQRNLRMQKHLPHLTCPSCGLKIPADIDGHLRPIISAIESHVAHHPRDSTFPSTVTDDKIKDLIVEDFLWQILRVICNNSKMKTAVAIRKQRDSAYKELKRIEKSTPGRYACRIQMRYIEALNWVLSEE